MFFNVRLYYTSRLTRNHKKGQQNEWKIIIIIMYSKAVYEQYNINALITECIISLIACQTFICSAYWGHPHGDFCHCIYRNFHNNSIQIKSDRVRFRPALQSKSSNSLFRYLFACTVELKIRRETRYTCCICITYSRTHADDDDKHQHAIPLPHETWRWLAFVTIHADDDRRRHAPYVYTQMTRPLACRMRAPCAHKTGSKRWRIEMVTVVHYGRFSTVFNVQTCNRTSVRINLIKNRWSLRDLICIVVIWLCSIECRSTEREWSDKLKLVYQAPSLSSCSA